MATGDNPAYEVLNLTKIQISIIQDAFRRGLRSTNLEAQPAPWLLRGLIILENGRELTEESIQAINLAGGTDHPDPWFG